MSLTPRSALQSGNGKDWSRYEASLVSGGLMVCDAPPVAPMRTVCISCRLVALPIVMRGPWEGLESADLHFRVCPGCGCWTRLSTEPSGTSDRGTA